jgi:hypothetical protein
LVFYQTKYTEPFQERAMLNNLGEHIRKWHEQAGAQQADARTDPKVKQQFLELERLWLLLARSYDFTERLGGLYDETNPEIGQLAESDAAGAGQ